VGEVMARRRQPLSRICCSTRVRIISMAVPFLPPSSVTMRLRFMDLALYFRTGSAFQAACTLSSLVPAAATWRGDPATGRGVPWALPAADAGDGGRP